MSTIILLVFSNVFMTFAWSQDHSRGRHAHRLYWIRSHVPKREIHMELFRGFCVSLHCRVLCLCQTVLILRKYG